MTAATPDPDAPGQADRFEELRRAAEVAYAERDDAASLTKALAWYHEAAALRPGEAAAALAIARAESFRAWSRPAEARDAWREAARAAERALTLTTPAVAGAVRAGEDLGRVAALVGPGGAEPLYWLALATMGMAQSRGMAAVLSVKDAARAMMERAAELDERLDHGGPRRALGAWLATIPSAAGGGAAAARVQFDRARTLEPAYQLTRVREAGVLAVLLQDRARFDALLAEVLASDDARSPEIAPENRLARKLARELLARRDRLF